jgi:RecJ-like exonuclease
MNVDSMSAKLEPEALEVAKAVKQALLELQFYATSHTVDNALGKSVEALVAAGAISPQTAAFMANHQARFYGFKPSPIRADIPVFDVVLADRTTSLRFVGFRDGHVERIAVGKQVSCE